MQIMWGKALLFLIWWSFFVFTSFAGNLSLDEIKIYQSLPDIDQPIVPLEKTFNFHGQRSTQITVTSLKAMDIEVFKETGGIAPLRNLGMVQIVLLVSKSLEVAFMDLTEEEMDIWSIHRILEHLLKINSPHSKDFSNNLELCRKDPSNKQACNHIITISELWEIFKESREQIFNLKTLIKNSE